MNGYLIHAPESSTPVLFALAKDEAAAEEARAFCDEDRQRHHPHRPVTSVTPHSRDVTLEAISDGVEEHWRERARAELDKYGWSVLDASWSSWVKRVVYAAQGVTQDEELLEVAFDLRASLQEALEQFKELDTPRAKRITRKLTDLIKELGK